MQNSVPEVSDLETQYLWRARKRERRLLSARMLDIWLTVFVFFALFFFLVIYIFKPTSLQFVGIDKRPTGILRCGYAIALALLTAAVVASFICIFLH